MDDSADGNVASDAAILTDYGTGEYLNGALTAVNKLYGRKFIIKSMRWLSADEI